VVFGKEMESNIPIPEECNPYLKKMVAPHVESFDWFIEKGIHLIESTLQRVKIVEGFELWLENFQLGKPQDSKGAPIFPSQCRQQHTTYTAPLVANVCFKRGGKTFAFSKTIGNLPIMVKSSLCYLGKMTPKQLIAHQEEAHEFGGYFIVNGLEKIIRLLTLQRRNEPLAVFRPSFKRLGAAYSPHAVLIRCAREDQTSQTVALHSLTDGMCTMRVQVNRREYTIPVVLLMKALVDTTDREIYERVVEGDQQNLGLTEPIELLLREFNKSKQFTREQCLDELGSNFRIVIGMDSSASDTEAGEEFMRRYFLVHLQSNQDKFELLIFMLRKLFALVQGTIAVDNLDANMNHEVLLPGHLYAGYLKECLNNMTYNVRLVAKKLIRSETDLDNPAKLSQISRKIVEKLPDVGLKIRSLLSTGNLVSTSGMDLMQTSGFTIIAEKLN